MKSQRATFRSRPGHLSSAERHRRSESGAAVKLTRGGELGFALGCACFQAGKPIAVFRRAGLSFCDPLGSRGPKASPRGRPATSRCSLSAPAGFGPLKSNVNSAVRRTAGLARWAFGPPQERAARNRQNWGGTGAGIVATFRSPASGAATHQRRGGGAPRTNFAEWGGEWVVALAARRAARAGRLPPGGPQHAACASRIAVPPERPTALELYIPASIRVPRTPVYSERHRN